MSFDRNKPGQFQELKSILAASAFGEFHERIDDEVNLAIHLLIYSKKPTFKYSKNFYYII
jgi:hypothetical protein